MYLRLVVGDTDEDSERALGVFHAVRYLGGAGSYTHTRKTSMIRFVGSSMRIWKRQLDLQLPSPRSIVRPLRSSCATHPDQQRRQYRGNPNPQKFSFEDGETSRRKEPSDSDWRNANRSPWQEITSVVERRKECDSEPPIRDCIQHAVTGCCQEQVPE
jgi:hypothetical protein